MPITDPNHTHTNQNISQLEILAPVPITLNDNVSDGQDIFSDSSNPVWCISCYIGEPTIIQGANGGKYALWTIEFETTRRTKFKIRKRFNDFIELRGKLLKYQRETVIPELPPKTMIFQDRFNVTFLQKRRKALEYWISSVVLNPVLGGKEEVKRFVLDGWNP
ncbi:hypothetical protein CANARDRAFT_9024 [[Candida] arabinofermentans NRRL YB-2248]|uniref:Endosomal/vacuolar adapter protein YPT35 n=1 Tax=[Candida] arabinofermentans NRRL YB-2248 TaxID=983967 RepID=A0A1E4SX24_9ASCO|nr:hypothetical protein CANARDRAFT_9024 [[Candida] arabinofermentans NRRL YB-2248]